MKEKLIVGTRGSALALVQAEMTEALLRQSFPELEIVRKVITTTGDRRTDVSLAQVAKVEGVFDKGVFIKELEVALEAGEVDLAVHSLKDMPTVLDEGFEVVATLERAPVADVLVTKQAGGLDALPIGAKVASSSCRRQKMLRHLRPDIEMVDIRGNVPTRLRKLAENPDLDGILLAEAGLVRLGYDATGTMSTEAGDVFGQRVEPETFLPAAGQGAVALEVRSGDDRVRKFAEALNHAETMTRITAEREFLRLLNGGCHTPVGVATQLLGDKLMMEAIVFPEGEGVGVPMQAQVAGAADQPLLVAETLFKSLS
ncbi:hydroxymethylbilane synthase [Rubritalea marina]|uniref:hydroxymethylbilane synthase n=1 Tax=Rubritalea marina TaxID=361055 RepID=UPI000367DB43|nr:hydroxymethylbilane synthase [Rubritalea marina]